LLTLHIAKLKSAHQVAHAVPAHPLMPSPALATSFFSFQLFLAGRAVGVDRLLGLLRGGYHCNSQNHCYKANQIPSGKHLLACSFLVFGRKMGIK
jgi:hypothetical protein